MLSLLFWKSSFERDKELLKTYANVDLDEATFARYSKKFTLGARLGSDKQIRYDYHGFGIPFEIGDGGVLSTILNLMENEGIIFEHSPKSPLGQKLARLLASHISNDRWLGVPDAYLLPLPDDKKMRATLDYLIQRHPT